MVDIIVSTLVLLVSSWMIVLISVLYVVSLQFPVLFAQPRIGKDGRIFTIYKFRTLKVGDQPPAQRRFWLGDVLRYTSLDELPQLINVLRGDMSIVGPRPLPVEYAPLFSEEERKRHTVRPGLTGLAQVNGRHSISWKEKFRFDLEYVRNITFLKDCSILAKTVLLLLSFQRDISLDEKKFSGSHDE